MAMAMMAISAVVGLAGSFMQASALNAQAKAQENIANFNAKQQEIKANQVRGESAVKGELQMKEAKAQEAKARAGLAQAGLDTTSGTPSLLRDDLITTGKFQQFVTNYQGDDQSRSYKEEAKATRYEGQIRAMASRAQAQASIFSGIGSTFGSLANFG
jgi:hypothetical protein